MQFEEEGSALKEKRPLTASVHTLKNTEALKVAML
jgi:hypothetical protein